VRRQDPYGNPRGAVTGTTTWPSAMDKGFVGGTKDNTGLTNIGIREYDPGLGRFISIDPLLDDKDPRHFDGYAYAFHSPLTYADPNGQKPVDDDGGGSGGGPVYLQIGQTITVDVDGGDGYIYTLRIEYYALCRNGGTECVATVSSNGLGYDYWVNTWELWRAINNGTQGVGFKIYTFISITRRTKGFVGPVVGPKKPGPNTSQCLMIVPPVAPAEKRCGFTDLGCLNEKDWDTWWEQNGKWIKGAGTVIGIAGCATMTAGVGAGLCTTASLVALGIDMGGEVADFVAAHDDENEPFASTEDKVRLMAGLGWQFIASKIPGRLGIVYDVGNAGEGFTGTYVSDPTKWFFEDANHTPVFTKVERFDASQEPAV
jgi:RHS repeat-associated protein